MTLQEFFDILSGSPEIIIFYFIAIPMTAFLANVFGKGEGHLTPWKYLYCLLVYLAAIPGIFAVLLNIYLFLFERQPVLQTNIYTQILPIAVMLLTLWLVKRNVPFELVPGFGKLSGLIMIIFILLALMWVLDRTRIFAVTFLPFQYVLLILILAFVGIRIGWKKIIDDSSERDTKEVGQK